MGHQRAFAMLVLSRPIDAATALACGLVGAIADDVIAASTSVAHEISALPEESAKISRRLLRSEPATIVKRMNDEAMLLEQRMRSPEAAAAFKTFLPRKTWVTPTVGWGWGIGTNERDGYERRLTIGLGHDGRDSRNA
jgi:enoyl-CoA hydratase/carnithine racemase